MDRIVFAGSLYGYSQPNMQQLVDYYNSHSQVFDSYLPASRGQIVVTFGDNPRGSAGLTLHNETNHPIINLDPNAGLDTLIHELGHILFPGYSANGALAHMLVPAGKDDAFLDKLHGLFEGLGEDALWKVQAAKYHQFLGKSKVPDGAIVHDPALQCFPGETLISMANGRKKPISQIRVGDMVMSFDPAANKGRGGMVPKRVTRLFQNSTTEFIKLTWLESGKAKELVATPGHMMLDKTGAFTRLDRLVKNGMAELVLESGKAIEVKAERIIHSPETAHLFEQATPKLHATQH